VRALFRLWERFFSRFLLPFSVLGSLSFGPASPNKTSATFRNFTCVRARERTILLQQMGEGGGKEGMGKRRAYGGALRTARAVTAPRQRARNEGVGTRRIGSGMPLLCTRAVDLAPVIFTRLHQARRPPLITGARARPPPGRRRMSAAPMSGGASLPLRGGASHLRTGRDIRGCAVRGRPRGEER